MRIADHNRTVALRFSCGAPTYHGGAQIQAALAAQLMDLVPADAPRSPILEVGCGTGHLTRHILRRWPETEIHATDIAPGMLECARQALGAHPNLRLVLADALAFRGPQPYDLILANCALHWLYPFRAGMANLLGQLTPTGRIAATVMLDGTLEELHAARLRAAPQKPPAGRLPTFEDVIDVLREHGLLISFASEERRIERLPGGAEVLRQLHDQGLTGGHVSRSHAPLNRRELAELARDYDFHHRSPDNTVPVSYHIGFFVARMAAPSV